MKLTEFLANNLINNNHQSNDHQTNGTQVLEPPVLPQPAPVEPAPAQDKIEGFDLDDPAPAPTSEPSPSGYTDTGETRNSYRDSACPICGKTISAGETMAALQAEGKSQKTYCHLACKDRALGNAQSQPANLDTDKLIRDLYERVEAYVQDYYTEGHQNLILRIGDNHRDLTARVEKSATEISSYVETKISEQTTALAGALEIIKDLKSQVDELESARKVEIKVSTPSGELDLSGEILHPAFEEVLALVHAGEEVFLPGPTGCGKSHMGEQIARVFAKSKGWDNHHDHWGAISCSGGVSESHFFGRLIPSGANGQFEFNSTQFLQVYENGGIFLLDEFDACDPNVAVSINSALANGWVNVPARKDNPVARRHPDFICIAAANTFGRGADRLYVGREQLDEATLDRFRAGTVEMDYDLDLETRLCPDRDLRETLWICRDKIIDNRLERVVSTRFLAKAYRLSKMCEASQSTFGYKSVSDYILSKLTSGWTEREQNLVVGYVVKKEDEE